MTRPEGYCGACLQLLNLRDGQARPSPDFLALWVFEDDKPWGWWLGDEEGVSLPLFVLSGALFAPHGAKITAGRPIGSCRKNIIRFSFSFIISIHTTTPNSGHPSYACYPSTYANCATLADQDSPATPAYFIIQIDCFTSFCLTLGWSFLNAVLDLLLLPKSEK